MSNLPRTASTRPAALIFGALLGLYLLSLGPAVVCGCRYPESNSWLRIIYRPFDFTPHVLEPAVRSYLDFCLTITKTNPCGVYGSEWRYTPYVCGPEQD